MPKKDLIGKTINNWTLISPVIVDFKTRGWNCRCSCGKEKIIKNISTVLSGKSTSCGCVRARLLKSNNPMFSKETRKKVSLKMMSDPNRTNIIAKAVKAASTKEVAEKRKATNIAKYGAASPAANEHVKRKIATTLMERYGVSAPAKNPYILTKMRLTMMKKYGVDNVMKLDSYRKQIAEKIYLSRRSKGVELLPNGLIAIDECKQQGVLPTTFRNWRREFGAEIAQAKLYGEKLTHRSSLERMSVQLLQPLVNKGVKVEIWNKKAHEAMKYKPDIKISYEDTVVFLDVDGLYWHSIDEESEDDGKEYHMEKAAEFVKNGLTLLQIREDEIRDKGDVVLSMISHRLGLSTRQFGARKLTIASVSHSDAFSFFNENHLMGAHNGSKCIGLYNDSELLCALAFRIEQDALDISRFACKKGVGVSGAFSKLISYLENQHPTVKEIINFVDLRYATGNSSKINHFAVDGVHLSFRWTDGKKTYNRRYCKADASRGLSEKDVASSMGLYKIYDAGQLKLIKRRYNA